MPRPWAEEGLGNSYLYAAPCVGRVSSARTVGGCPVAMAISAPAEAPTQPLLVLRRFPGGAHKLACLISAGQQDYETAGSRAQQRVPEIQ